MKKISLSTVLFALLAVFVIRENCSYVTAGRILFDNAIFYFLTYLAFIALIILDIKKNGKASFHFLKLIIIWLIIIIMIAGATGPRIKIR